MRIALAIFLVAAGCAPRGAPPRAAEITLKCTADNSVCCHKRERRHNMGGRDRLKIKGIENFLLLNFEAKAIRGKSVKKATLYLKNARPKPMLRLVGVSTVATAWTEGGRKDQEDAQEGESCFLSPALGKRQWAGPRSDFLHIVFGQGGTFWRQVYIEEPEDGWFRIPVDPRIVEAMAQGFSQGMAVSDDNGEVGRIHKDVWPDTIHDNNYVWSRESKDPPRLVVVLEEKADKSAPGVVKGLKVEPWPAAAGYAKGAARVSWTASGGDGQKGRALGYLVSFAPGKMEEWAVERWRIPAAPAPGQAVSIVLDALPTDATMEVRVQAVDGAGNKSEPASTTGSASPARAALPRLAVSEIKKAKGAEPPARNGKLRAWAFGDGLKVNPVNGNLLEERGVEYGGEAGGSYRRANVVWDGAKGEISLRAARGEWVAFQLCLEAVKGLLSGAEVSLGAFAGPDGREMAVRFRRSSVSRAWYIKSGDAWYADPLVPVAGRFAVPWKRNAVPGQRNQTLYIEFFVPRGTAPGRYQGAVTVSADGVKPFALPLTLTVLPFAIPKELHFVWSMNAYGSPGRAWGKPGEAAYAAAERDFYVKSHQHRTCLAILHYTHSGRITGDAAPPIKGKGKAARVADWTEFDRRFGPLFDGSAFKGTAREGAPLDHFYLTFHENWPAPMAGNYKWNVPKWEQHWKVAGPIGGGFSKQYQDAWKAVLADFEGHFREKGWKGTRFQIYLNNKFFYKMYGRFGKRRGRGTSFWLLDEPTFSRDFQALAFFSRLTRAALAGRSGSIVFRGDISRPESQRDTLDGLVDVNVCGDYAGYRRLIDGRRARFGETLWTYGGLCKVKESALVLGARALTMYCRTVDGYVPWKTLDREEAWTKPSDTIAFYSGRPVGIRGCVPSLRLKACRRGQQDVEYLWLLGRKLKLDRRGVADLGAGVLKASAGIDAAKTSKRSRFKDLDYAAFERFRRTVAGELGRRRESPK